MRKLILQTICLRAAEHTFRLPQKKYTGPGTIYELGAGVHAGPLIGQGRIYAVVQILPVLALLLGHV